jgi:glyoxylase-like metal-dependent hydrolase (beta-lactamase superfamily II)
LVFNLFIKKMSAAIPPVKVDEWLTDQQLLPLAGGLRVVHTPGHSAGHVALLLEQEGVLIAGDLCANMAGLAYSTVYEDLPQGRQSILQAAALPFDQAVFGHGSALQKQANRKLKERFERPSPTTRLKPV